MTRFELRRLQNKNAVMLALEMLCHEDCLAVVGKYATDISPLAGRSPSVVRETLKALERDKVIVKLDGRDGISTNVIVLMDRPGARAFVREQRLIYTRDYTVHDRYGRVRAHAS